MIKSKAFIIVALLCLAFSVTNAADIIYVDAGSPNDPGTGTSEDPFRRIQDAINSSISGDTVEIRPGVYTGAGNYNLDPDGKSIVISGTDSNDADIVNNTIIDPEGEGRGFYVQKGEDANCVISGLTIRNACAITDYNNGAGIYCYLSNPTIRNCVIRNGHARDGYGGGLSFEYSDVTITNCIIADNKADYYGGGISCISSSALITNCTISGNTAILEGGGIDSGESNPDIFNCVIIANNAPLGAGINCYFPGVANLVNCTIVGNLADHAGGAIYSWNQGSAVVKNSILWANTATNGKQLGLEEQGTVFLTYSNVQGGQTDVYDPCGLLIWDQGNIDIDPCFASFNPNGDPNFWDFHLKSTSGRWNPVSSEWVIDANLSQCIDAGDPNSDWSQEPWPNGKRINMGAYGGTNQASKSGLKADFDVDGFVDFVDFSYLASKWNLQQSCIEDLNDSGDVDIYDLKEFCVSWLTHN